MKMPPTLSVANVSWSVDGKAILQDVALEVRPQEFVGILGPNGSGKSSLLRCIFRYFKADSGEIMLNGKNINVFSVREAAQHMATVLQERSSEFNLTALEFAMMGRTPHKTMFDFENSVDILFTEDALDKVGLLPLRNRRIRSLSGGELQRAMLARALCQQAELLLLDEPTNHLDIRYQMEVMQLIKTLRISSLAALHELNLAAMFCDRLYILSDGKIVASGTPKEVLTEKRINEVYGVRAKVRPLGKVLNIVFLPEGNEGS